MLFNCEKNCDDCNLNCAEGSEECMNEDEAIITMIDADSGEEYQFALVDDFEYKLEEKVEKITIPAELVRIREKICDHYFTKEKLDEP